MSRAGRPSEINRKAKGRMGINGASGQGHIPDDIEWDADNPPVIFACSQNVTHISQCDGTCESQVIDESKCNLINEGLAWRRAGMAFLGVPAAYEHVIPVDGIKVELHDLELKNELLLNLVMELAGITREEIDAQFRELKLSKLREIREANEANVRRVRAADALGIAPKRLLGPHGEIL